MGKEYKGKLSGEDLHFAVVVSSFNDTITTRLLEGAKGTLASHGVSDGNVDVAWVPGAFEIPLVAKKLAQSGRYAAVICLGAVIKGGTSHNQYIATQAAQGIARVALETDVPVIFGVVTADSLEQALERAGAKLGNRGSDAARAAIEMANLLQDLQGREHA